MNIPRAGRCEIVAGAVVLLAALPMAAGAAEYGQTPAGAPPANEIPAPLFEQLDANHDGFVTVAEAKRSADITARFKDLDVDRDGKISLDEFKKGAQQKM